MLEFEVNDITPGALASRTSSDFFAIGTTTKILNRTFLFKKMEINFSLLPSIITDDATTSTYGAGYLVLQNTTAGTDSDTVAESFDAELENTQVHNTVIWAKIFSFNYGLRDDADQISYPPGLVNMNTSKSFSKGFPLDKDETYTWRVFNNTAGTWVTGNIIHCRVRMFGVYL